MIKSKELFAVEYPVQTSAILPLATCLWRFAIVSSLSLRVTWMMAALFVFNPSVRGDCNSNGVADATDITGGTSTDCNTNSIPDECDIAALTSNDCNTNGVPDSCDLNSVSLTQFTGLVSWWSANGDFLDSWGSNHGVNAGSASFDSGRFGQGFSFDGAASSYVTIPFSPDLIPSSNQFTICAWIKPNFAAGNSFDAILSIRTGCGGPGFTYALNVDKSNGGIALTLSDAGGGQVNLQSSSVVPNDGQFHFVAGTYDGSLMQVFIDGIQVGQVARSGPLLPSTADAVISHHGGSCPQRAAAVMDEIQLYDRALTSMELATLAALTNPTASLDCNTNGVPDECDLGAGGGSLDCNTTGIPDECELSGNDCNANVIPDDCELTAGTAADCNANGIPDECDITQATSVDCNTNGVPDGCDIAVGEPVVLLLHADGQGNQFSDATNRHTVVANGDAAQSSTQSKFGGSSAVFDGVGDFLSAGISDDWNFGLGDFTIDFWVYPSILDDMRSLVSNRKTAGNDDREWSVEIWVPANTIQLHTGTIIFLDAGSAIPSNAWTHVAVVRNNGILSIYYNGILQNSVPDNNNYDNGGELFVGHDVHPASGGLQDFTGFIDELRISKGVALWTSNFSPPALPAGSTGDCNANGIPDACDIAAATSVDCNTNGVPDACDPDCNNNGVADECEPAISPIFVDDSATNGVNDGSSWANAFIELQDALDVATCAAQATGTVQVWVAAGTYLPNTNGLSNPRDATFRLANNVELYGGFAGTETLLSQRDPVSNVSILSGDLSSNDSTIAFNPTEPTRGENAFHVVTANAVDASARLDGFEVSGGNAADQGGAVLNVAGSPTIISCRFERNSAVLGGAAIHTDSTLSVTSCGFTQNAAGDGAQNPIGGAIKTDGGMLTVTQCSFVDNTGNLGQGGAIGAASGASLLVSGGTFTGNGVSGGAGRNGGAIFVGSAPAITIRSSTFQGNGVGGNNSPGFDQCGGAICVQSSGGLIIEDCVFNDNTAGRAGRGGAVSSQSTPTVIRQCSFSRNTSTFDGVGGAIRMASCPSSAIVDSTFVANFADANNASSGGALRLDGSSIVIEGCGFYGNSVDKGDGGAVAAAGQGDIKFINCVLSSNVIGNGRGGAIADLDGRVEILDSTLERNSSTGSGGGVYSENATSNSMLVVRNSIFRQNQALGVIDEDAQISIGVGASLASVRYSLIDGLNMIALQPGNIDGDPGFVRLPMAGSTGWGSVDDDLGDLRPQALSPVIDAGSNGAVPADSLDLNSNGNTTEPLPLDRGGEPRFIDDPVTTDSGVGAPPIVDMGAYEFQSDDCNHNDVPDAFDIAAGTSIDCIANSNGIPDECEPDCNANGVADGCDIAGATSADCNGNTVPDSCDIASLFSMDCNTDGIPDECQETGNVVSAWASSSGLWSQPDNWCPDVSPDNSVTRHFDVAINGPASVVTLNISPTISTLELGSAAIVQVGDASGANVRSLAVEGAISNSGSFRATDRERFVIDAPMINQSTVGVIEAIDGVLGPGETGDKSIVEVNGSIINGGTLRTIGTNSEIHLIGGAQVVDVNVEGVVVPSGQTGSFAGQVINDGVLEVGPGGNLVAFFLPGFGGATLNGNGGGDDCVRLGGRFAARLGDAKASFENAANHIIDGAGTIDGSMVNHGTIRANNPGLNEQLILLANGLKTNTGTMVATNGATLRIDGLVNQNATGVIETVGSGQVLIRGDVTGNGTMRSTGPCTGAFRGCTPPILVRIEASAIAESAVIQALDFGRIELAGSSQSNVSSLIEVSGGVLDAVSSNALGLVAGGVNLKSSSANQGEAQFRGSMVAQLSGALTVSQCAGILRGCTPPILSVSENASLTVGGEIDLQTDVQLTVTTAVPVSISSDFRNAGTTPAIYDWSTGSIQFDSGATQTVEAAGTDLGATTIGFDTNFAFGSLSVGASTTLQVVDDFDNQLDGTNGCGEALYVNTLIVGPGGILDTQGCPVYYLNLVNNGGSVVALGSVVVNVPTADFDDDGDVDGDDYLFFNACLESASPAQICLDRFDGDHNQALDLQDYAHLQRVFDGG